MTSCARPARTASATTRVFAILGAGADTFIASSGGSHTIFAGTADGTDTEADVIRSSGYGLVISGMAGQPNADIIDLAFGEVSWSGIQTAPGAVSVGTDGILGVRSANGDVTMDASGTVTGADTALTWTGRVRQARFHHVGRVRAVHVPRHRWHRARQGRRADDV